MQNDHIVSTIMQTLDLNKQPAFQTLVDVISKEIHDKSIKTGSKLPPYRTLSWRIGLSPGTVQKAYRELERQCLIIPRVGDGSYVLEAPNSSINRFRNSPRQLCDYKSDPDSDLGQTIIDLSRNQFLLTNDLERWRQILDSSTADHSHLFSLLNYTDEQGLYIHRLAGAQWFSMMGVDISPDQIFCTNGAQNGINLSLNTIMRPMETIAVDKYTYPGILALAKRRNIRIVNIEHDDNGLLPDDLCKKFQQYKFSGLFVMPTIHNPLNIQMPDSRRDKIADFCARNSVFIIEDETQGILNGIYKRSFFDRLPQQTILISSVSKALSSGLRVGYIAVPHKLVGAIRNIVQETCWMASPISHEFAHRCIASGYATECLNKIRLEISRRKKIINDCLSKIEYFSADYSPHYWIPLPANITDVEMVKYLSYRQVKVSPSLQFCNTNIQDQFFIRASITAYASDKNLAGAFVKVRDAILAHR